MDTNIFTLPFELLEAVVANLDWKDVLRSRTTCKVICDASKSLTVWRNLFFRLSDMYIIPICLPRPMDAYTSHELETVVLRWYKREFIWDPAVCLMRPSNRLVRSASDSSSFTLIEGGRWLLTTDDVDQGSIMAHFLDSDAQRVESVVLIPPSSDGSCASAILSYVDHNSSVLSFDLAISFDTFNPMDDCRRVEFWRVTEHVEQRQLSASHISTVSTTVYNGIHMATSFLGPWYARFLGLRYIEVFDWRRSSGSQHRKSVVAFRESDAPNHFTLLPGSPPRLLTQRNRAIGVYPIPEPLDQYLEDPLPQSLPLPSTPVCSVELSGEAAVNGGIMSAPCTNSAGDTYITFATSSGFDLLHLMGNVASVTKLFHPFNPAAPLALGAHRAVGSTTNPDEGRIIASFRTPRHDGLIVKYHHQAPRGWGPSPVIDEWSGRSVDYLANGSIVLPEFSTHSLP